MRRSIAFGLYRNAVENVRNGNTLGTLFEIGSVFSTDPSHSSNAKARKESSNETSPKFFEPRRMAFVSWGENTGIHSSAAPLVLNLRSTLEKLFQNLQISAYSFVTAPNAPSFLHLGQWAQVVVEGQNVGYIGSVHPRLLSDDKVRVPMAIAELDLNQILKGQPRPVKFKSLSKFQPVERDFAFVMESAKHVGDLLKEAKKACGASVRDLHVFDIYEGDKLPAGQKSVAVRAVFQGANEALTEENLQQLSQKVVEAAKKAVNAQLR